jgi:hypothetical protein
MKPYTVILMGDEGYMEAIRVDAENGSNAIVLARQMSLDAYIAKNSLSEDVEMDTVIDEWEGFYEDLLLIEGHPEIGFIAEDDSNHGLSFRFLGQGEMDGNG